MSNLIDEIKTSKLLGNPELRARQLEKFLREQPFEVRKYLQAYLDDIPLTKSLKRDYSSDDSGD